MIIKLSEYVTLRPQQIPFFDAYFNRGIRNIIGIAHRRFGKGLMSFMLMCCAAMHKRGVYGHLLPTHNQARKVIWQTISSGGIKLIDRFPPSLVASINHSEQKITLINGSVIYVTGSDNYKRLIGMDFTWLTYDEFQDSIIESVNALRPMLTRNKGTAVYLGTPRAYNHFKDLYDEHVDDPAWYCTNLTINDTVDEYGKPIITEEDIEIERKAGMPESLIQQEYYGSFSATLVGAYYSNELNRAKEEGRIGNIPFNPQYPVYTSSDWGYDDATAFWFFQHYNGRLHMIDYFEAREQNIEFYVNMLKQKQRAWGCRYAVHFGPHDLENRELIAGKSRKDAARELGIMFRIVQAPARKIHGIHCVRYLFDKLCFNEKTCRLGLKHLTEYHSSFDEKNGVYSMQPKRNAATHGADAMQTAALGWLKTYDEQGLKRQFEIANLYSTLIW